MRTKKNDRYYWPVSPIIRALLILYFANLFAFAVLYSLGLYQYTIFQSVLISLSSSSIMPILRNTLMLAWMLLPVSLLLYPLAVPVLKLTPKKFLYVQVFFLATLFVSLRVLIG